MRERVHTHTIRVEVFADKDSGETVVIAELDSSDGQYFITAKKDADRDQAITEAMQTVAEELY